MPDGDRQGVAAMPEPPDPRGRDVTVPDRERATRDDCANAAGAAASATSTAAMAMMDLPVSRLSIVASEW
jgi:hypothetical protein